MYIIAGKYKKRSLIAPKTTSVRPTTGQLRETVFNICQLSIEEARFLDLFAGSGAMGLEALSRGAAHTTFVENNRLAIDAIKKNITSLGVSSDTTLLGIDVFKALQRLKGETFDIIYADPPYGEGFSTQVLTYLDEHPLLAPDGSLFIEYAPFDLPPLKHLQLQSERSVGRAKLYHFKSTG